MQQINWNGLGLRGESKQKSFENICLFLFCRELGITKIDAYYNQPGIETEPVEANGKKYGFQAKFFEGKFDWQQIKKSVLKAIEKYPNLDKIFIYSNKNRTKSKFLKSKIEKELEREASKKDILLEYITDTDLLRQLSSPKNLDISQLYFGLGDHLMFIRNSVDLSKITLLQSVEYVEIPLLNGSGKNVKNVTEDIIASSNKLILIKGHPGSGKSIFVHKLLQVFGGLDRGTEEEMLGVIERNGAVPILINLKNCATESLESILRVRKEDCKINNQKLDFIYLFDGLDEVGENTVDLILSQIYELSQKRNTKKLVISCRSGNANFVRLASYFNEIVEYTIGDLDEKCVGKYFHAKNDTQRNKKLKELKRVNRKLLGEIRDILSVKLLWETIFEMDEQSDIIDLLSTRINHLLDDPNHKKNITELNLLNPKKEEIFTLNQEISFKFQQKFQFRFPQRSIQKLILRKFERLDYSSTNKILEYIAGLFFDDQPSDSGTPTYVYQHRRYQEFFFAQKLKREYEKSPSVLRELNVVSNREFFNDFFLRYVRKEYERTNDIKYIIELNLIDAYLGNRNDFGAEDPYYLNSNSFFPSLAKQKLAVFNQLIEDESLGIKEKISLDMKEVKKHLELWKKDKKNYWSERYLENVWQRNIVLLLELIVVLWKEDKAAVAAELIKQLNEVLNIFKESGFLTYVSKQKNLRDPFWENVWDWMFYRLIINDSDIVTLLKKYVRVHYKSLTEVSRHENERSPRERWVCAFLETCLDNRKEELCKEIDRLTDYEFLILMKILATADHLPLLVSSKSFHERMSSFLKAEMKPENPKNIEILFHKKFFGISLDADEVKFSEEQYNLMREKRGVDWRWNKTPFKMSLASYILNKYSFDDFLKKQEGYVSHIYNEIGLYAALFKSFIDMLKEETNIEHIVRDYLRYVDFYYSGQPRRYLRSELSILFAHIFSKSKSEVFVKKRLKNLLFSNKDDLLLFSFYNALVQFDAKLFTQLLDLKELESFEEELGVWDDDFQEYIERCFQISLLFSTVDPAKATSYFIKGIKDGILRHGWHKDTIVSYHLTDAFEIVQKNSLVSEKIMKKYARRVLDLTVRVSRMTDGDHTHQGPINLIENVAKYNIPMAFDLRKRLIHKKKYELSNELITVILKARVKRGLSIDETEQEMQRYRKGYNQIGKITADLYEQKFVVYLAIAECNLYTDEDRRRAFEGARAQIEELRKKKVDYYLSTNFTNEKRIFKRLCEKYGEKFDLSIEEEEKSTCKLTEDEFVTKVKEVRTKSDLKNIYDLLHDYKNRIILKEVESWKILINKTVAICKNISLFTEYLRENHFPQMTDWTKNEKYPPFAIAAAMMNPDTKEEMMNYLHTATGREVFVNMMRVYESLGDRDMCLQLFDRYLEFCEFLVY